MSEEDSNTRLGYQIPKTSNVAKAVLDTPTKLRITSLSPKEVNSFNTLWNLKIQTYTTEKEIIIWAIFMTSIILFYLVRNNCS